MKRKMVMIIPLAITVSSMTGCCSVRGHVTKQNQPWWVGTAADLDTEMQAKLTQHNEDFYGVRNMGNMNGVRNVD